MKHDAQSYDYGMSQNVEGLYLPMSLNIFVDYFVPAFNKFRAYWAPIGMYMCT